MSFGGGSRGRFGKNTASGDRQGLGAGLGVTEVGRRQIPAACTVHVGEHSAGWGAGRNSSRPGSSCPSNSSASSGTDCTGEPCGLRSQGREMEGGQVLGVIVALSSLCVMNKFGIIGQLAMKQSNTELQCHAFWGPQ